MANKNPIEEVLETLKSLDGNDPREAICKAIVATMPEEVKKTAATNPAAVKVAIEASMEVTKRIGAQLMFLLITQPHANHECTFRMGNLSEICKEAGIQVREGEAIKTDDVGIRPTQKTARA